jgi:hypothetical protein
VKLDPHTSHLIGLFRENQETKALCEDFVLEYVKRTAHPIGVGPPRDHIIENACLCLFEFGELMADWGYNVMFCEESDGKQSRVHLRVLHSAEMPMDPKVCKETFCPCLQPLPFLMLKRGYVVFTIYDPPANVRFFKRQVPPLLVGAMARPVEQLPEVVVPEPSAPALPSIPERAFCLADDCFDSAVGDSEFCELHERDDDLYGPPAPEAPWPAHAPPVIPGALIDPLPAILPNRTFAAQMALLPQPGRPNFRPIVAPGAPIFFPVPPPGRPPGWRPPPPPGPPPAAVGFVPFQPAPPRLVNPKLKTVMVIVYSKTGIETQFTPFTTRLVTGILNVLPLVHETVSTRINEDTKRTTTEEAEYENIEMKGHRFGFAHPSNPREPFRVISVKGKKVLGLNGYKGVYEAPMYTQLYDELCDPKNDLRSRQVLDVKGLVLDSFAAAVNAACAKLDDFKVWDRNRVLMDDTKIHFIQQMMLSAVRMGNGVPQSAIIPFGRWALSKVTRRGKAHTR